MKKNGKGKWDMEPRKSSAAQYLRILKWARREEELVTEGGPAILVFSLLPYPPLLRSQALSRGELFLTRIGADLV